MKNKKLKVILLVAAISLMNIETESLLVKFIGFLIGVAIIIIREEIKEKL